MKVSSNNNLLTLFLLFSISAISQDRPNSLFQINKLDENGKVESTFFGNPKTDHSNEAHPMIHTKIVELIIPEDKFVLKTSAPTTFHLIGGMKQNSVELFSGDLEAGEYEVKISNFVPDSKHYWIEIVQDKEVVAKLAVIIQLSETGVK